MLSEVILEVTLVVGMGVGLRATGKPVEHPPNPRAARAALLSRHPRAAFCGSRRRATASDDPVEWEACFPIATIRSKHPRTRPGSARLRVGCRGEVRNGC